MTSTYVDGISGHGDVLLRHLPPDSPLRRHAEEIKQSCKRCAALTNQLLTFKSQPSAATTDADLGQALLKMETFVR